MRLPCDCRGGASDREDPLIVERADRRADLLGALDVQIEKRGDLPLECVEKVHAHSPPATTDMRSSRAKNRRG
ncbi:hypothetical protein GCM10010922_02070 [Microbacterium sorbitolivorans]|nr:hypothetical protein GCM10010922_02070 [Microbacterium sorbitolivorans]